MNNENSDINIFYLNKEIDYDIVKLQNEFFLEKDEKNWYGKIIKIRRAFEQSKKRKMYDEYINKNKIYDYYENHKLMKQKKRTISNDLFYNSIIKRLEDWLSQPVFENKSNTNTFDNAESKSYLSRAARYLVYSIMRKLKNEEKEKIIVFHQKLIEMHCSYTKENMSKFEEMNIFLFKRVKFSGPNNNPHKVKDFHLLNDVDEIESLPIFHRNCVKIFTNLSWKYSDLKSIIELPYKIKETFFIKPFSNNPEFYKKEYLNDNDIIRLLIGIDILMDCFDYYIRKGYNFTQKTLTYSKTRLSKKQE